MERQSSILKETKIWALNNNNEKEFQLLLQNIVQMLLGIVDIRGT